MDMVSVITGERSSYYDANSPIEISLDPLRQALTYFRSKGYMLKRERNAGLTWEDVRNKREPKELMYLDSVWAAKFWRRLCRIDGRPCIVGEAYNQQINLRVPKTKATEPIRAWASLLPQRGSVYVMTDVSAACRIGVSVIEIMIRDERIQDLWLGENGFPELAQTIWRNILKPM